MINSRFYKDSFTTNYKGRVSQNQTTLHREGTLLAGWALLYNSFGGIIYIRGSSLIFSKLSGGPFRASVRDEDGSLNFSKCSAGYVAEQLRVPLAESKQILRFFENTLDSVITESINEHHIDFPDYSVDDIMCDSEFWVNLPDGMTLRSMRYGRRAQGQCGSVAEALHQAGYTSDVITISFKDGKYHAAGTLVDDERLVLDYTARQYGSKVPFPLIAPKEKWLAWVEASVLCQYGALLDKVNTDSM